MKILMILIYSGLAIDTKPYISMDDCIRETKSQIGQPLEVNFWDNMNGSNPIPKVVIAYCVNGSAK